MTARKAKGATEVNLKRTDRQPTVYLSISQIAGIDGSSRETVSKKLDAAGATPAGKRGGWPVYDLKIVWPIFLRGEDAEGSRDPDKLDPIQRKAHYSAEREKRNLAIEAGQLVRADDAAEEMARQHKIIAQRLETIPDILERDCGATPQQLEVIERELDKVRTELADAIQAQIDEEEDEVLDA